MPVCRQCRKTARRQIQVCLRAQRLGPRLVAESLEHTVGSALGLCTARSVASVLFSMDVREPVCIEKVPKASADDEIENAFKQLLRPKKRKSATKNAGGSGKKKKFGTRRRKAPADNSDTSNAGNLPRHSSLPWTRSGLPIKESRILNSGPSCCTFKYQRFPSSPSKLGCVLASGRRPQLFRWRLC